MSKIKIKKNTVQETLMLPLYGRAYCSQKYPTLFPDKVSEEMVAKIDYDFDSLDFKEFAVITWAIRKHMLNECVKVYLRKHPKATIINLGCGFVLPASDTRRQFLRCSSARRHIRQ